MTPVTLSEFYDLPNNSAFGSINSAFSLSSDDLVLLAAIPLYPEILMIPLRCDFRPH